MAKAKEETPMLKHFFSVKAQHPEAILLYRVGDFYETYADDAVLTSKVLGLVLTKRSNADDTSPAMCGFPHHAMDTYLPKLVRAGYKVAVCDQLEDPKLAAGKLVKRGITEILTPGVAFGDTMLDSKKHNYLLGLNISKDTCGAAFLDVSTGSFKLSQGPMEYINTLIASLDPKEIVVQREYARDLRGQFPDRCISTLDEWAFVQDAATEKLCTQLGVKSLKGFGADNQPLAVCAAGALIYYLEQTEHTGLKNICSLSRIDSDKFVWMDRFTFRNLEIFDSTAGRDGVSLFDVIDRCSCPMGSRLLREWLAMPVMDIKELESRYEVVQFFFDNPDALDRVSGHIADIADLERIIARAATGRIAPRELSHMARSLEQMAPIAALCGASNTPALVRLASGIRDCSGILGRIRQTLAEVPAAQIGKGDVIASGVDARLDDLRAISSGGKQYLEDMQSREIERTGISSLKISYNNVFGYYIDVRNTYKDMVPPEWIRKQTLVGSERYITEELKEYEQKIVGAEGAIYELESSIYAALVADVQKKIRDIQTNCAIIARLDVLQGFARQALDRNYCRPVVDRSSILDIRQGRHPVIETMMEPGQEYVPNDLLMDSAKDQIIILTGPNMAGKSALLRQSALIVLMAQIGSFVPAQSVRMGWFDKIFTRVGASDNISRGESTFMVEMLETAMIMNNLSQRSLILLDEIGRGTSTYDGMSIARALVEYIHKFGKGAKTLFATHYHELNDMEKSFPRVVNYHIAVREDGHNVIFLRKLCPGGVEHSFGIHVARLAGMPREVIDSAQRTLRELESKERSMRSSSVSDDGSVQLAMFQLDDPTLSSLREKLQNTNINDITPLQAFDLLREMKHELGL